MAKAAFEMEARFDSRCAKCKSAIKQGARIKYHPDTKSAECSQCFAPADSGFISELVADEIAALDERYRRSLEWKS
jgi:hypothetical protein